MAARIGAHPCAHLLHGVLNLHTGFCKVGQQMPGVQPVATRAIGGSRPRGCCKRNQGARQRVDLRQAGVGQFHLRAEGIVAASVENDEVGVIARGVHLLEDRLQIQRGKRHFVFALDVGIDRYQVIPAAHLHAMAGEIEQAQRFALELVAKFAQGQVHILEAGVFALHDVETGTLQQRGHVLCVIDRIGQRHALVSGVSDHQCDARRFLGGRWRGLVLRKSNNGAAREEQRRQAQQPQ